MRYVLLQQVGGPAWMVYDTQRGMEVKTFYDKYAREVSSELCNVLNRGNDEPLKTVKVAAAVQEVRTSVPAAKKRQRVLRGKVSDASNEGAV